MFKPSLAKDLFLFNMSYTLAFNIFAGFAVGRSWVHWGLLTLVVLIDLIALFLCYHKLEQIKKRDDIINWYRGIANQKDAI
jgi:hypothetical protein